MNTSLIVKNQSTNWSSSNEEMPPEEDKNEYTVSGIENNDYLEPFFLGDAHDFATISAYEGYWNTSLRKIERSGRD